MRAQICYKRLNRGSIGQESSLWLALDPEQLSDFKLCILKINPLFLKIPYSLQSEDTNTKLRDLVQWKRKLRCLPGGFLGERVGVGGAVWKRGRNGDMNLPFLLLARIMKKLTSDGKSWVINHHIIWMFLFNKYPCLSCSLYPTLYFSHNLLTVRVSWVYKEIKRSLQSKYHCISQIAYSLTKSCGYLLTERITSVTLMRLPYIEEKALLFHLGKSCEG